MNIELWIDACRLQALLSQLEAQEDRFTEVANIKELALLKQGVAAFIEDHASRGSIPSDPLAMLQAVPECIKKIDRFLDEIFWPIDNYFLSDEHWWCIHYGFRHNINSVIPDRDFYRTTRDPKRIPSFDINSNLRALEAGCCHCSFLSQDGNIYGWGNNDWLQTTPYANEQERELRNISEQPTLSFEASSERTRDVIFSPDGSQIVSATSNQIKVWDVRSGKETASMNMKSSFFAGTTGLTGYKLGFSPNGKWIFKYDRELNRKKFIEAWGDSMDLITEADKQEGCRRTGEGLGMLSPDGSRIYHAWIYSKSTDIYDSESGKVIYQLEGNFRELSPDGKRICFKNNKVCDAESGTELYQLKGDEAVFSPDGKRTCASTKLYKGNTSTVHDAESGTELYQLKGGKAVFSPDGKRICASIYEGNGNYSIDIWNADSGRKTHSLGRFYKQWINASSFSPDSKLIVLAYGEGETSEGKLRGGAKINIYNLSPSYNLIRAPASTDTRSIAAGDWHGVALNNDGTLIGWGNNDHGQATPPDNLQEQHIVSIAAGGNHSLALLDNGTVVGWGSNHHGQITPPENLHGVAFISAGQEHSLALLQNGTVVGWGNNYHGQASPPENLQGVTAIAAGGDHSLALLNNGTVVGWGSNGENQAEPPAGLQGVKAITAGGHHSLALLQNGTVVGWGNNDFGQATPPPLFNVIALSAGKCFSVALKSDGSSYSWGYDIAGDAPPPRGIPGLIPLGTNTQPGHSLACIRGLALTGSGQPGPANPDEVWTEKERQLAVKGRVLANELAGILCEKLQANNGTPQADAWLERLSEEVKQTWINAAGGLNGMPLERIAELDEETARLLGVDGYSREELLRGADLQGLMHREGPIHEQMAQQLQYMETRLDTARMQAEFRKRQAPKLAGIAFILVNQAMWNFDGISPNEYRLMLEMMEDWDRRLGMRLGQPNIVRLIQWAINKWNEDAQAGNHDNYQVIVGNLARLNHFERPIVPVQLHKLGDLDGGITAEQLKFIHDIEAYLSTEGLVSEEDENLMNTDEAICYIFLVMALWDDDGLTAEEQGAIAEMMANFSIGLTQETLIVILENGVQRFNQDSEAGEIAHLEECVDRANSGLSDTWKHWLIDSLRYLSETGGTTDQQQKDFLLLLSKQLGIDKEPEQAAA